MFIDQLAKIDSACDFQLSRLRRSLSEKDLALYRYIDAYLESYCEYYDISPIYVQKVHEQFIRHHQVNLANFRESHKYPWQLKCRSWEGGRIEYDIILILSFLLEKHRFRIATWLVDQLYGNDTLCIGIGPGVELGIAIEFLKKEGKTVIGYDLEVSEFVRTKYGDSVQEERFTPDSKKYDEILLIEILEHLSNPDDLITTAAASLAPNGRLIMTTAINIPQFDHLYNFTQREIVEMLKKHGLEVLFLTEVNHLHTVSSVDSSNELVVAVSK